MAVVGSLLVELSANVARLKTDMERAAKVVEANTAKMAKAAQDAAGLFKGLVAVLGAQQIAAWAKSVVDAADALNDLSERTGIGTKSLQELGYAAQMSGSNVEELQLGLRNLAGKMADAQSGNEQAVALFRTLGVSVTDATGKLRPMDDVLGDLAEAFAGWENGANKSAIAAEVFGAKAGTKLIGVLNQGRDGLKGLADEAQRMGAVLGEDAVKQMAEFNDNLDRLGFLAKGAAGSVLSDLLPAVNRMAADMLNAARDAGGLVNALTGLLMLKAGVSGNTPAEQIADIDAKLVKLRKSREAFDPSKGVVNQINEAIWKDWRDTNVAIEQLERARAIVAGKMGRDAAAAASIGPPVPLAAPPTLPKTGGAGASAAEQQAKREADAIMALTKKVAVMGKVGELEKLNAEIEAGAYAGWSTRSLDRLRSLASQADSQQALADDAERALARLADYEKREAEESEKAEQRLRDLAAAGKQVFEDVRTPIEQYAAEVARLNALLAEGVISTDTYQRAVAKAYGNIQTKAEQVNDLGRDMGMVFQSAFEDAIVGGKKLRDVMQGLLQDIARLVLRQTVTSPMAKVISAAIGGFVGGGAGIGYGEAGSAAIGALVPDLAGNLVPALASGGPLTGGVPTLVGEEGPELILPGASGTVIPNHALGGESITVVQNINVSTGVAATVRHEIMQMMPTLQRATVAAVADRRRRGGNFAKAFA